jgi:hypothetical protein
MSSLNIVRVEVREIGPNVYEIALPNGEILATGMANPEGAACAALHARGVTGIMATHWPARAYPSLYCDIGRCAASHHEKKVRQKRDVACADAMAGEC